jgi:phosphohistidine swiveling domain-containing protein
MIPSNFILNLKELDNTKVPVAGGKASHLGVLLNAGFKVPNGFVITTEAYRLFIQSIDIDASNMKNAKKLRESVQEANLPSEVINSITDAYDKLGNIRVAVRSSATAEDMPEASFAGQYETFLNIVGLDSLLQNVKHCFASLWTDRAIAYREENNIDHGKVQIAVVVQSMVQARSAGVLFTRNPLSSSESEMMIESNFGLGESVVSGQTIPDRYIVEFSPTNEISLVSKEIGTKDMMIEGVTDGVHSVVTSPEKKQQSSLDDNEVVELAKQARTIEKLFNAPQDIEWAIDSEGEIHILQSRPITVDSRKEGDVDSILWTRGYADDYWNDPVTPLFYDLLGDQITYIVNIETNAIMGYKDMPEQLLKLHKAHVYFNLDVIRTKVVNEIPPFIRSEDVLNYFPEGSGSFGKETMRSLPFALKTRIMAEIRVMLLDADGSMTKTNDAYKKWTEEIFNPYCDQFDMDLGHLMQQGSIAALMSLADELDKVMMKHFRMVRYGIPVHTLGMNLITNYLLRRWLGEKTGLVMYPILLSGLEHKTTETNRRMIELASQAGRIDELKKLIIDTPSTELYVALVENDAPSVQIFVEQFNSFLDDFGDRGFTREPYYPRWRDSPEYVFDALKPLVSEKVINLIEAEQSLARKRAKAEVVVEKHIRNQRYGPIKLMLFSTILGMARTYIGFRENQRFNLDRWITRNRRVFLEIGNRLVENGCLEEPAHVFFLHRRELRKAIKAGLGSREPYEFRELAKNRYKEFLKYENSTPPKFMIGSREFDDPLPDSTEGYVGIPASQGIISGHVRVLETIDDIPQVRAGEILIVPRTDPGWTPVFSKIGGLVTESGGVLSHGAVVSREFGIPAVTNVRNACQVFKSGQRVRLDGNQGLIVLLESE